MKRFQFFTTDTDMDSSWFPIDHFFFAPYSLDKKTNRIVQGDKVVHLEMHAAINSSSGLGVSVVQDKKWEEFDDIPSALRRMADIIEAHSKKKSKR
jgi:hypothetical protein